MPQQVFLSRECFAAVETVIRAVGLNAHVQLDVSVEVFPATVGLGTAIVRTRQNSALSGHVSGGDGRMDRGGGGVRVVWGRGLGPQRLGTSRPVNISLVPT